MAGRQIWYVLRDGTAWKVKHGATEQPYVTQTEAINAARGAARAAGEAGADAQVLVQAENGQWRTEWTYGHDPERSPG